MMLQIAFSTGQIHACRDGVQHLAVLHGLAATEPDLPDAACGDKALVGVVVHVGDAVLRTDHMAVTGIVDHDVGIAAGAESLSAAESSRTGHTVCTTIHSNSCNSTYRRMMTLAKRKYNMDDSILMQIMVEAYPIIVFTKQLEDRSRKIMEIIEGEDYQDGRLIAHSLYKYEVEDNVTDDRGETRVVGHHKKIGLISDSLKKRLLDNGISNKELEEFMQPPKEVG